MNFSESDIYIVSGSNLLSQNHNWIKLIKNILQLVL